MFQAAAAQTPLVFPGRESQLLDDEFYDIPQPTSARAIPSSTAPFTTTLTSILERQSLEDIQYFLFLVHFLMANTVWCGTKWNMFCLLKYLLAYSM